MSLERDLHVAALALTLASCARPAPSAPTLGAPSPLVAPRPRELELISERALSAQKPKFWPYPLGRGADGRMLWQVDASVWRLAPAEAPRILVTLEDSITYDTAVAPDGTWIGKPKADGSLVRYATADGHPLEPAGVMSCDQDRSTIWLYLRAGAALVGGRCGHGYWVAPELGAKPVSVRLRVSTESSSDQPILPATATHPELMLVFDAKHGVSAVDARGKVRWRSTPGEVTMGGAASLDGNYVVAPVYERDGIAILDGTTGKTRWFLEPEEGDWAIENHRMSWLRDGTLMILRDKRAREGSIHTVDLYEITEAGPRLVHRSPELDLGGTIFPIGVDEATGEWTIVEPSGHLVTRDKAGTVLRRTVLASDGGGATLHADGTSQCQGSGCKLLRPKS